MSKKEKVSRYRSMELLDSIFSAIYGDGVWFIDDLDNVRKMYKSCHALLNAPEKPWQEYEKEMKKFDKQLNMFVFEMTHRGCSECDYVKVLKEIKRIIQQDGQDFTDGEIIDQISGLLETGYWYFIENIGETK